MRRVAIVVVLVRERLNKTPGYFDIGQPAETMPL